MCRFTMTAAAFATALMLVASGAQADETKEQTKEAQRDRQVQRDREAAAQRRARRANNRSQIGKLDEKTPADALRASQLIGMNIQDAKGEDIAEIHDLVLDAQTMEVRYAAVSYGGFLNLGDKLFAVPIEAIQYKTDPEDRDEHILVMNVTEEQLEGAEGFDEDSWPNFADSKFTAGLDKRYGVDRDRETRRRAAFRRDRNETERETPRDRNRPRERTPRQPNERE